MTIDLIQKAKEFATKKFESVGKRNHFLDVFAILKNEFEIQNDNILIAGLLHDVLEDTDTNFEEIENEFSKVIADLVQEVSHPKNYTPEQKIEYYEKIKNISTEGKILKMADFTSNLRFFISVYKKGDQSLYPKFSNNDKYIASIRDFLSYCNNSLAKEVTYGATQELENLL